MSFGTDERVLFIEVSKILQCSDREDPLYVYVCVATHRCVCMYIHVYTDILSQNFNVVLLRLPNLMGYRREDLTDKLAFDLHHHEDTDATLECSKGGKCIQCIQWNLSIRTPLNSALPFSPLSSLSSSFLPPYSTSSW